MSAPLVSIIMPTFNRRRSLLRAMTAAAAQDYPRDRLELIVVSDGSTDGSLEAARRLRLEIQPQLLEQPNRGPAAARNLALGRSRGELVVFLDDDVVASPGLVAAHVEAHAAHDPAVVIGPLLPAGGFRPPWIRWEASTLASQYELLGSLGNEASAWNFYTGNASVPRKALDRAGGFDESLRRAEDIELGFRLAQLGFRFRFEPRAGATHMASRSLRAWLRTAEQYGRNEVRFGRAAERAGHLGSRHPATRLLVGLCLDRPGASALLAPLGAAAAWAALLARQERLAHALCGALFNLRYWQAFADEVGGRDSFEALARAG